MVTVFKINLYISKQEIYKNKYISDLYYLILSFFFKCRNKKLPRVQVVWL